MAAAVPAAATMTPKASAATSESTVPAAVANPSMPKPTLAGQAAVESTTRKPSMPKAAVKIPMMVKIIPVSAVKTSIESGAVITIVIGAIITIIRPVIVSVVVPVPAGAIPIPVIAVIGTTCECAGRQHAKPDLPHATQSLQLTHSNLLRTGFPYLTVIPVALEPPSALFITYFGAGKTISDQHTVHFSSGLLSLSWIETTSIHD